MIYSVYLIRFLELEVSLQMIYHCRVICMKLDKDVGMKIKFRYSVFMNSTLFGFPMRKVRILVNMSQQTSVFRPQGFRNCQRERRFLRNVRQVMRTAASCHVYFIGKSLSSLHCLAIFLKLRLLFH